MLRSLINRTYHEQSILCKHDYKVVGRMMKSKFKTLEPIMDCCENMLKFYKKPKMPAQFWRSLASPGRDIFELMSQQKLTIEKKKAKKEAIQPVRGEGRRQSRCQ